MKKIILIILLVVTFISNIEAYQTCNTDIQMTFKSGLNVVLGLTEGIQIYK